jgi:3-hydroxyacyl-[acyl-carrier-protein] dehydratase
MNLTPHGPGFSFLDKIEISADKKNARGEKHLDPAAAYFADHFPGNPLLPGVLLVECAAQAAGALWGKPQAFLASIQQFRFSKPVLPGQTIVSEITFEKDFGSLVQFDVILRVASEIVAQGKLTLSAKI